MKINRILFCLAFAALPFMARADDESTDTSVKLSAPDKPATVRIYVASGAVKVIGTDAKDVVSVHSSAPSDSQSATRPDGLRVISTSGSYSLVEKDNVVELSYGRGATPGFGSGEFTVSVPKNAVIEVSDGWNTDVSIENVSGDVTVKNMNGSIRLANASGGALVETMNGEIKATFVALTPDKPLSFTSMNGQVELHVPADAKANVRFRTQNGSILTDFPEDVLKTKAEPTTAPEPMGDSARMAALAARDAAREGARIAREVAEQVRDAMRDAANNVHDGNADAAPRAPRAPRGPRPPSIPAIVGGKVVTGTLNGGGTDVQIATMNGNIVVRKIAKP